MIRWTKRLAHFTDTRGDMALVRVADSDQVALITWGLNFHASNTDQSDSWALTPRTSPPDVYCERVLAIDLCPDV